MQCTEWWMCTPTKHKKPSLHIIGLAGGCFTQVVSLKELQSDKLSADGQIFQV